MRVWDIEPSKLCRKHLLGEHVEIHAIFNMITQGTGGTYHNHPEVQRWKGKAWALVLRHEDIVAEMLRRGFNHNSPLNETIICDSDSSLQSELVHTVHEQQIILNNKPCDCMFWGVQ